MKELIKISKIENNTGQIPGLKANPRLIIDEMYNKLLQSIRDLPEMLEHRGLLVFPYNGKYVAIGGNMRLKALQELGYKEVWCEILSEDTTIDQMNEMIIKDNLAYGSWDYDMLGNEWDDQELLSWGMALPIFDEKNEKEEEEGIYEISTKLTVECLELEKLEKLYNELQKRGFICKLE